VINSWLLALLMAAFAVYLSIPHLYTAAFFTIVGKCILIPYFLRKVIRELKVTREVQPYLSMPVSLIISFALVVLVYSFLAEGIFVAGVARNVLKISVSIILISLFTMMNRKKAVTQVMGLLFMESGLFLAGFSLTYGLPTIIELGVLFDMMMGVMILGIFLTQIKKSFVSVDLDQLTSLKG
jgi:hydrogenase-4 component E